MDDFLHNLRQEQKKAQNRDRSRHDKTRPKGRSYSTRNTAPASGKISGDQAEQFKKISESLASVADNQHLQIALSERIAVAQEKQAQAMDALSGVPTKLIDAVSIFITSLHEDTAQAVQQQPYAFPPNLDELKALSRDEVKVMIRELRDLGLSYEKIANKLNDRKIRTITGRGIWQAQTVYRLHLE